MSLRQYTAQIANGANARLPVLGNLVFMRAATAQVLVTLRKNREGSSNVLADRSPLSESQKIVTPELYDDILIENESGGSVDLTIIAGEGDYEAPIADVTLTGPNALATAVDVTAGAAATSILAADSARRRAHIKALMTNTQNIRVGDTNVAANRGAQLQPGEGVTIEGTMQIFAIREAAGTVDLSITTERLT